jgi:PadR family transcriptional regulator PadR
MLLSVTEGTRNEQADRSRRRHPRPVDSENGVALEPMHGWAIAHRIRQKSGDVLQVGQGALYPALHKLEQNGWISAEWANSENNRRAKYYALTTAGRKVFEHEAAQWERLSAAISLIVRTV